MVAADTSFLFSLYGNVPHGQKAVDSVRALGMPLHITGLNDFEFRNSVRFSACRGFTDMVAASECMALFDGALAAGRLIVADFGLGPLLREAGRHSEKRTLTGGQRGFDILQVAAAKLLGADRFLTFDANQKRLAEAEGFVVPC